MFNIGQRQQKSFKHAANNAVLSKNQEQEITQPDTLQHPEYDIQQQESIIEKQQTIVNLHNDVIDISLSSAGGTIQSAALKNIQHTKILINQ